MQKVYLNQKKNITFLIIFSFIILMISAYAVYVTGNRYNTHGVIISEICTNNKDIVYDANGFYGADYVEIYNYSASDVNLAGYGLSDNEDDPYRWTFPAMTLKSGECLLLFGEYSRDIPEYYKDDYYSPMIGFGFKYGETCFLTDDKGVCISRVGVPSLEEDKTLQVTIQNLKKYVPGVASPGSVLRREDLNPKEIALTDNVPVASAGSGFYDSEIFVTLSSGDASDTIYYTLDGSIPDESSSVYTGPILVADRTSLDNNYSALGGFSISSDYIPEEKVDKCTVLKAVCIDKNGKKSRLMENTYFIGFSGRYGIENIPVISLSADPSDFFSSDKGIYVLGDVYENCLSKYTGLPESGIDTFYEANYYGTGVGWERRVYAEFWGADHQKSVSQELGIRIHGANSRICNQKGFGLYADGLFSDDKSIEFDPFNNGAFYDRLVLRTGDDLYNSKIRDAFVYTLIRDRNAGYQESVPCAVFLNGEYWGLYILQEKTSKCSISYHYGIPSDDLYVMKQYELLEENSAAEEAVKAELYDSLGIIEDNDMSLDEVYAHAEAFMDIQSFIDYCCIQTYIGNWDWWRNNTAFFRSRSLDPGNPYSDMKWRPYLYDLDESQGLIGNETDHAYDSFYYSLKLCPVLQSLMQNQDFRRRYVISFMDIANNNFNYDRVHNYLNAMADIYREPVVLSQKRWRGDYKEYWYDEYFTGNYDEQEFDKNIKIIDDFYRNRFDSITGYLGTDLELKGYLSDVSLTVLGDLPCDIVLNTISFPDASGTWSGKYYTDYPITLSCVPKEPGKQIVWTINGNEYSGENIISVDLSNFGDHADICVRAR